MRAFFRRVSPPRYTLSLTAGDGQTATANTAVSTQPQVRVLDNTGAAVVGAQVLWAPVGDGTVNTSASVTVATDASGYSAVTHTLSATAGPNVLTATLLVTGAVVTFTQTGTADVAATIQANSFADQAGSTSTTVTTPPSVLVLDQYGNAVSGTAITWAVASGGGSVNTTGGTSTSATGVATLTSWTLGASVGANSVTATAAGLTGSPVTFTASASAGTPTQIVVQSGGTQTGIVAGQAATAITFRVKDAGNTGVQSITVSFSQSGAGSLSVASAVTNASGDASVTLTTGSLIETNTITGTFAKADGTLVSATTTVASTFGTKSKLGFQTQPSTSGSSGTALSQQPILLVQDANGNTVTSATDLITATVGTGNATITAGSTKSAVSGVATFSGFTVNDVDGGANVFHFAASGLTGCDSSGTTLAPPVPVALLMGTQPSGGNTNASFGCTVRIADSNGTTVPGATDAVTAALTTPGGAVLSGTLTVNASNGVATFVNLIVDTAASFTLTFTSGTLTPVVSASFAISTPGATNEPAGMTPFLGASGKILVSGATQLTMSTIQFKDASTYTPATTTLGVTLSPPGVPPTGDTHLGEITFPLPFTSGSGHGTIYCTPNLSSLGAKQLYMRCYAKVSDNWYGESTGTLKFFQPLTNTTSVTNRIIGSIHGAGSAALKWKVAFQSGTYTGMVINGSAVSTGTTYYSPIAGTGTIVRGQWHLYEMWVQANTAGNADGSIKMWIDGTLTHSFLNNCRWDATGFSWLNAQIQSVYGGPTVANAVPDDQYIWVASPFYVSTHA